jgi:hypothetical protein
VCIVENLGDTAQGGPRKLASNSPRTVVTRKSTNERSGKSVTPTGLTEEHEKEKTK